MKNNILQSISLDYRYDIIKFISEKKEVTVSEIINEFDHKNNKQTVVSQTLNLFRKNGLVDYRSEKQKHIYFIKSKYVQELIEVIEKIKEENNNAE